MQRQAQTLTKRKHIPNASANANETPARTQAQTQAQKKHKGERKGFNVNAMFTKNAKANEKASASAK